MERLTDERFWDEYWAGVVVPTRVDETVPFERALAAFLAEVLAEEEGSVLEVGCAPGKWLAYVAQISRLMPAGIEYSRAGLAATRRNFAAHGIEPGALIEGDFFAIAPERRFDVVMSFGFVEHFDDPCEVVARHLEWLRPGGLLVIGVPNFTGVHGWMQRAVGPETYAAHNLEVMDPAWFEACGSQLKLATKALDWMAGFEPALPVVEGSPRTASAVAARVMMGVGRRVRRGRMLDQINGPKVSGYLVWAARNGEAG